ncbi:hypothetical protein [Microvirga sp. Mcv34]|uniref:hypothetical protein n=1 Tax=Microvirga sp. Mcv34 TaxID=2926016 RepID=UPI0021C8C0BE|nr:hypothetical protein [Microvirga sp. Mcv34]
MNKIAELASLMGVSEADVRGFVAGLSVWIEKGFTFEEAIEKNLAVMTGLANNAVEISKRKEIAVEAFFPA